MPDPAPAPASETTPPSTALAPRAVAEKVPARLGIIPTTVDEGWRLATMMARSELVPKAFRNKPEDVMIAVQLGAELGLAPMQALQSIAVINGRPSVWGDGLLAIVMASPLYQDHDEYYEVDGQRRDGLTADDLKKDATAAVCTFIRRGKGVPVTRRFSIANARKAQLLGKDGPWQTYPDRMLAMLARSFAARDAFPDLLRGLHTAEEMRDLPADAPTPLRQVMRASELPPATGAIVASVPVETEMVTGCVGGIDERAVVLTSGEVLILRDHDLAATVLELQTFVGTTQRLAFQVARHDNELVIESFQIAN